MESPEDEQFVCSIQNWPIQEAFQQGPNALQNTPCESEYLLEVMIFDSCLHKIRNRATSFGRETHRLQPSWPARHQTARRQVPLQHRPSLAS
jgi:hypothetical protein